MNFLENLWNKVKTLFTSSSTLVHNIVTSADKIVNEIKILEASEAGQFLEVTIETLIPSSTGLVNAFREWLPLVVTYLNWAVKEEGKTGPELVAEAIIYLEKVKGLDLNVYATQLNSLDALMQKWLSDNLSGGLTIQQTLTLSPVNHSPELIAA